MDSVSSFATIKVEPTTSEEFHREAWACDTCDREFPDFTSLQSHVAENQCDGEGQGQGPSAPTPIEISDQDQETPTTTTTFQNHILYILSSPPELLIYPKKRIPRPTATNFVCVYCRQLTPRKEKEAHELLHKDAIATGTAYTCLYCPAVFDGGRARNSHEKLHTPYICPKCGVTFPSAYSLEQHDLIHIAEEKALLVKANIAAGHLKRKHPERKCPDCGVVVGGAANLWRHRKEAHQPREALFSCSICQKRFYHKTALDAHVKIHNYDFPCSVCGKEFRSEYQVEIHKMIHENEIAS
jgi:transcription elongation factor Elf1